MPAFLGTNILIDDESYFRKMIEENLDRIVRGVSGSSLSFKRDCIQTDIDVLVHQCVTAHRNKLKYEREKILKEILCKLYDGKPDQLKKDLIRLNMAGRVSNDFRVDPTTVLNCLRDLYNGKYDVIGSDLIDEVLSEITDYSL